MMHTQGYDDRLLVLTRLRLWLYKVGSACILLSVTNIQLMLRCRPQRWLGRPTLVGKALSFTHELSFLSFFFINTPCSAAAQWMAILMYFGGSVVGKASRTGMEISPTPSLMFTGGQESAKFGIAFKLLLKFEPHAFENAARYPNSNKLLM